MPLNNRALIITGIFLAMLLFLSCGFRPVDADVSFGPEKSSPGPDTSLLNGIPPENIGYLVYDLDRKTVVRSHNRTRPFIPASTTKVPATVFALNVLGPEYRFETYLSYKGSISKGVLKGDLYLKGTGDPLLTVSDLMAMIDRMKEKGIASVEGRLCYDESALAASPSIDPDMEPDVSFNSGVSALSLDYNTIMAEWKRDKKAKAMEIFLTPTLPVNGTGFSRDKLRENIKFTYRELGGSETWLLSPDETRDGTERLPVKKPGRYTAHMFAKLCAMRGIAIKGPIGPGAMPLTASAIATHRGQRLADIVDLTLTYSINLMAELAMLGAVKDKTGNAMRLDGAALELSKYFSGRLENIDWKECRLFNGSGLTPKNRITPEQMTAVLVYADAQDYGGKKYRNFLPASGWEWSLMNRFGDPNTAFHVWAKTGTINYAVALAGYLYTKSRRTMAFTIYISDIDARQVYDSDPDRRSKESMAKVYGWLNSAKKTMDGIVTGWVEEL
ncbi:MAG: D-alanyl-D-alanine carboxypeptidase/D-alanyl-D-alanine-endopeptidase [Spirochaetes bacterium]|nr:D-alanyl-D-alanine carboxypeptidase/D-alanyl-D-alanine-endopeptidase [Spirochaetota bacterium]